VVKECERAVVTLAAFREVGVALALTQARID
jgi:hypothetical protein